MIDIRKASGEIVMFDRDKFCQSVQKAGAPDSIVQKVCALVAQELKPGISTEKISQKTTRYLIRERELLAAARYNLRSAIMQLGPAGFFFEEYIAAILREYGYSTKVGQILQGKCIAHEVDILAEKEGTHYIIEAKYHNERGVKSSVQVAMYTYARFLDIKEAHEEFESPNQRHYAWLITNTKFTLDAATYAECRGVKVTGWQYPARESLQELIVNKSLYPVTVLPSVNRYVREQFALQKLYFARDILAFSQRELEKRFQISQRIASRLVNEAYRLV